MAHETPVLETSASFYDSPSKKWIDGLFQLYEHHVQFNCENQSVFSLSLNCICGLEKRQSSLVYPSICIVNGAEKLWFASFQNRDAVYNMIELFWRESLLSTPSYKAISSSKKGNSNMGKELLTLLRESESTLVGAANSLVHQGRQLEESQMTVADINTDLSVAEKLMKNMSFSQAMTKLSVKDPQTTEVETVSAEKKPFRVTFAFTDTSKDRTLWEHGRLTFGDEIVLLNDNLDQKLVVKINEVEKIQVMTPWEFQLQYSSESVTSNCFFMCPQLSRLLVIVNHFPLLKNKIEFENDSVADAIPGPSDTSVGCATLSPGIPLIEARTHSPKSSATDQSETMSEEVLSDEDMEEISNMITSLKILAADVKREQQTQLEKIDSLITDVENTELRMNADNKKIKKMF